MMAPLGDPKLALATTLRAQSQRRELSALGEALNTPVLFLKAAWADPVLYGGRGERWGGDVDILIHPRAFAAFGERLVARGYKPRQVPTHRATLEASHERLFMPPDLALPVDVHRAVASRPWFNLPTEDLLRRARAYPSPDGPIWSLSPEDQLLFAAVHYANHGLELDERHLMDCARLLDRMEVDWRLVAWRARRAQLSLALAWLGQELLQRGVRVPGFIRRRPWGERVRLRAARRLARDKPGKITWRQVAVLSLLSGKRSAPAAFALRYAALRVRDRLAA